MSLNYHLSHWIDHFQSVLFSKCTDFTGRYQLLAWKIKVQGLFLAIPETLLFYNFNKTLESCSKMNFFNLLKRINEHTLISISAAFVSVKHIKIIQTSNCWFDRMIYFSIIGKSWVTCSEVCFGAMKVIY